jgi:YD repeat-containing protein
VKGNRLTTAYADGRSETRSYDGLDRIRSLTEGGRVTTWHYDQAGRAIALSLPNGQQQDNYHDAAGRLVSRHLFTTAGALLATFLWLHAAAGNVLRQSETWPGDPARSGERVTTMGYDDANRLLSETVESTGQPLPTKGE